MQRMGVRCRRFQLPLTLWELSAVLLIHCEALPSRPNHISKYAVVVHLHAVLPSHNQLRPNDNPRERHLPLTRVSQPRSGPGCNFASGDVAGRLAVGAAAYGAIARAMFNRIEDVIDPLEKLRMPSVEAQDTELLGRLGRPEHTRLSRNRRERRHAGIQSRSRAHRSEQHRPAPRFPAVGFALRGVLSPVDISLFEESIELRVDAQAEVVPPSDKVVLGGEPLEVVLGGGLDR